MFKTKANSISPPEMKFSKLKKKEKIRKPTILSKFLIVVSAYIGYNTQNHLAGACKRRKTGECRGFCSAKSVESDLLWVLQASWTRRSSCGLPLPQLWGLHLRRGEILAWLTGGPGGARAEADQGAAAAVAEAAASRVAAAGAEAAGLCPVPQRACGAAPGCCHAAYGRAS